MQGKVMLDARYRKFGIKMRAARYKMLIKTALHDRYRRIEGGKSETGNL